MRALFVVDENYKGTEATLELLMSSSVAFQTQDEEGPLVRVQLGAKNAGSLIRWLQMTYPDAEAHVVGVRCQVCNAIATVNLHLLGDEGQGHWCDVCVPDDKREEHEANKARGALPHENLATVEGVAYYLRSAYGFKPQEVREALRQHPYTIATAASRGMTIEAVAVDIQRRWTSSSARLQLEQAAAESQPAQPQ